MSDVTKLLVLSVLSLGALVMPSVLAGDSSKLTAQDRTFMTNAAKGGMMEVHMGHMGLEHGSSAKVKEFSQRLIDDHTKGNNELMDLAKQKGVTLPKDNPSDMPKTLSSKSGADFDREFAKVAVTDHQKDIIEFEKEASSGSDPDVKAWASKTLPTLRAHLSAAEALSNSSAK